MDGHETYAKVGIRVVEREGTTVFLELSLERSTVLVIADFIHLKECLVIDKAHVDGSGLTRTLIRKFANIIGQVENVREVVVQGGKRTSGRRVGSLPTPIHVKVQA